MMYTDREPQQDGLISNAPVSVAETVSKPEWHRPTITRIDIKRTLFGSGSVNDATTFPQTPLT